MCYKRYDPTRWSACPLCRYDVSSGEHRGEPEEVDNNAVPIRSTFELTSEEEPTAVPAYESQPKHRSISQSSRVEQPSFMSTLFSSYFDDFIYVRVAGFLYVFFIVGSALSLLAFEILDLITIFNNSGNDYFWHSGSGWYYVAFLALAPFVWLLTVILNRMLFESGVALIKIAENTRRS